MAPKFDEVDVFTIPHSRMKQLVRSCTQKVTITDFTDRDALMVLLSTLYGVFKEFKSHEEIENECIMRKLKIKLKERQIHNSAVCNCHKDDQFSPLIDLVNSGYVFINKQKTASDKLNYGVKLRKALKNFTKDFVPHMKEEEEVFQPLLVEHFDEEELVEMKNLVIKLHLQQRKQNSNEEIKIDLNNNEKQKNLTINSLPNEILLNVFSYLNQRELLTVATVSRGWNLLSIDSSQWKSLSFSDWLNMSTKPKSNNYSAGIKDIEYIDDSDEEFDSEEEICSNEIKMLHFWIKYLLPRVGHHINTLDLSSCKSINNNLARRIFQLCPNVRHLDLSYSNVGDNAFKGVKFEILEYINFEGCKKITDETFKYLFIGSENFNNINYINIYAYAQMIKRISTNKRDNKNENHCEKCTKKFKMDVNIEEFNKNIEYDAIKCQENIKNSQLRYLNLSGCYMITDLSFHYLALKFNLSNLQYLNLSGCPNLSSNALNKIVDLCRILNAENVYYCDNIINGPFDGMANGCENVECTGKFCCRNSNFLI